MLTPGTQIGPYQIVSSLGAGGMGEVYRARDLQLDRDVALKILPESFASDRDRVMRFEREAKTLAALNHPHIAQIYGLERSSTASALVMELVDGEDLAARIARGPLDLDEAFPIARQIAEALEAAHEAGIVHRDLKPANIKVRRDGTVKVLDFGLAKAGLGAPSGKGAITNSSTFTSPAMMTHAGVILGTAAYMSPEQARGKPVDHRSDIWAFGCVLYEMLTGQQPFAGETVSDSIASILSRDLSFDQLPPNTPTPIRTLLRRCLAKDPRARLHSIADARLEVEEAQSRAPELPAVRPRNYRVRYLTAGALAGLVASALAAYVAWPAPPAVPSVASVPMHLSVPMPSPTSAVNGVLLSPDGRYLITRASGGTSTLHAFDGSASRPLEASALCWSPDGRSVVVQREGGRLLRMDLFGGAPIAFATVSGASSSCTWSRHGVLLITAGPRGLHQVTIADGKVTPIELDDGNGADTPRLFPRFLPDGRRFLYWSLSADGQGSVRAGSLDSRQTTLVVASDAPAVYSDGYLLFQRGATLVAQPFDDRTLTLGGEPRAITSETAPGAVGHIARFDVSESGALVFATTNGGGQGQAVWFDRRGNVLGTLSPVGGAELVNVAISRDGAHVVGNRMDPPTGNWDIWSVDLRSGIPTRLTTQPGVDADAVWSPDGSEVAYVSHRPDASGIYRLSIRDGREQLLLKFTTAVGLGVGNMRRPTDWTPDGRVVIYEAQNSIMTLPVDGTATTVPVATAPGPERYGKISPDGRWIAFLSGESAVYVQPFPGPGPRTRVSSGAAGHPAWRRDGAELFYASANALHSVELVFSGNSVRATVPKQVLPSHVVIVPLVDSRSHYAVSTDGQRFLLRQADGLPGPTVKMILNWKEQLRVP